MTAAEWTTLVVAVIGALGTALGSFLLQAWNAYLSYKQGQKITKVEEKVDHNTAITQTGVEATRKKSEESAVAAVAAKEAAQEVNKKLNGGVDAAIKEAIKPLKETLEQHAAADEKNIKEVTDKFDGLEKYVHQRNHDILDAIGTVSNRVAVLTELINKADKK